MAKARTSTKSKTKAELLQEAVAESVGAGKELHLESVDFSDPNRPKTCLEVDFPILPINTIATIEGKGSGALKPIYQTMKWWARRRSTVFRQLLISAATRAPEDETTAAKLAWDSYYGNHQNNEAFRKLKVADIFMGGGTTIVEGSRLGMQMYGNDLNPVAWLVVKNEMSQVNAEEVSKLLDNIKASVKPQIMPFYACSCPHGHRGKWTHKQTGETKHDDFDPLSLTPGQRAEYSYEGPEVIYTFWAKHGPCQAAECKHRTPILSTPVVASRSVSVKAWPERPCSHCGKTFDVEQKEARLAPRALWVVSESEKPFATMDSAGNYKCPHCNAVRQDEKARLDASSGVLGKAIDKKILCTILVHPKWIRGASALDNFGSIFGGSVESSADSSSRWHEARYSALALIEVRGTLPKTVCCPDTGESFDTGKDGGTVPGKSKFKCKNDTCGREQDILSAVKASKQSGPFSAYAIQGFCPVCHKMGLGDKGKFFDLPDTKAITQAHFEWETRSEFDLAGFWPNQAIPFGYMTGMANGDIRNGHGFTHWKTLFNPRQLLVHSQLLKALLTLQTDNNVREYVLGVFQQYLRNQNLFCFWNSQRALEPMFSNNNYHPKSSVIESSVFSGLARGDFASCGEKAIESLQWSLNPWEISTEEGDHSTKVLTHDPIPYDSATLTCGSASSLTSIQSGEFDLVITDPPFGGLLHYSELADFFYVWLRIALSDKYPKIFGQEHTPKSLEAVANRARNPDDSDAFYQKILTECWRETHRILKAGGLLAFTFHHSEDEPWVAVLESLFDAGFILEATYPIRSDESKGDGEFGSKLIEFDIVHVCRKRIEASEPISWAKLRRQIARDVRQIQEIIEQHQKEGLGDADLQVIKRGKALEYYSRHYGKVFIERGREDEFTVKDALVGINQLLDDERDTSTERPPESAEPYTRQFLRLFANKSCLDRDQIQKHLRGTGVSPSEFVERGWCAEEKKIFTIADPLTWAQDWKGKSRRTMARDFDQAYFLIGASYENSGIKVSDTLSSESFVPHPALGELLTWFVKHSPTDEVQAAAKRAKQLYAAWQAKNTKVTVIQRTLFDLEE